MGAPGRPGGARPIGAGPGAHAFWLRDARAGVAVGIEFLIVDTDFSLVCASQLYICVQRTHTRAFTIRLLCAAAAFYLVYLVYLEFLCGLISLFAPAQLQ